MLDGFGFDRRIALLRIIDGRSGAGQRRDQERACREVQGAKNTTGPLARQPAGLLAC
jgi:hypothetical protein